MNAIVERLKQIPAKLLEFWNKYNSKQKTLIVCITAAVFLILVGVVYFLSRPKMEELIQTSSAAESSSIINSLDAAGIRHKTSRDGLIIYVDSKKYTDALLQLAENNIPSIGMTLDELFDNGFTTTESEKKLKANIYKQDWLRNSLLKMENIEDATVSITPPTDGNSIFESTEETSVSVILTIGDGFRPEMAKTIANIVAGAVGNKTTNSVTISDHHGNLLFSQTEDLLAGTVNSTLEYQQELSNLKVEALYQLLMKIPAYDDAKIVPNLLFDMDQMTECFEEYTVAEGNDQGYLSEDYLYKAINTAGVGGTPGTSSNDEADYMIEEDAANGSTVNITNNKYLPNKRVTNLIKAMGTLRAADSSIAINLISYRTYKQEDLKRQGLLEETTWEDYVLANDNATALEVSEEVYNLVAKSTGLDAANIQILAWEVPIFQAEVKSGWGWSNYLMIILTVLIVALLIFVVFRGSAPVEVTEMEPELSVEQLLATTKENQSLEDIEFSEKSETRRTIEKFVDENPEAVAQLLRNWLTDDWG